jgi:hypothetical protein
MNKTDKWYSERAKWMLACILGYVIVVACMFGGIGYVAFHFIAKFW